MLIKLANNLWLNELAYSQSHGHFGEQLVEMDTFVGRHVIADKSHPSIDAFNTLRTIGLTLYCVVDCQSYQADEADKVNKSTSESMRSIES
jgi:hypothetical protein